MFRGLRTKLTFFQRQFVRRVRAYIHFLNEDGIMPEDVCLMFADIYQALSDLPIEDLRFSKSWVIDDDGTALGTGDVYQACIIVLELDNQEYDSVVIPMVKKVLIGSDNLITHSAVEDVAQFLINNNLTPRYTNQVVGLVGAYYGITKILNQ